MSELDVVNMPATQSTRTGMTCRTLGRVVMWLLVVLTLAAFADGLRRTAAAGSDRYGLRPGARSPESFFAGLFAILAWRPGKVQASGSSFCA